MFNTFTFQDLLGDNGVFIYPTYPSPAIYHHQTYTKTPGVLYTMIFNILGMPATHVPLGLNRKGLPIGIQVSQGQEIKSLFLFNLSLCRV